MTRAAVSWETSPSLSTSEQLNLAGFHISRAFPSLFPSPPAFFFFLQERIGPSHLPPTQTAFKEPLSCLGAQDGCLPSFPFVS